MMECLSYALAEKFDLAPLEKSLKEKLPVRINRHDRVLEVIYQNEAASFYLFANGTVISWGLKRYRLKALFSDLKPFASGWFKAPVFDGFTVAFSDKTAIYPHDYFNVECITLENDDEDLRLSIAYAVSLSTKLKAYENDLEILIERYNPFVASLSGTGELMLSQRKIRQIIGDVLMFKSRINLNSSFLSVPKFFWQHPPLEEYFATVKRYLDIDERASVVNHQLDTLSEIFTMCNSYSENRHSHRIEIIIVFLIFLEIVFYLLNLHLS